MAQRTIEVCDGCGKESKRLQQYFVSLAAIPSGEHDTRPPLYEDSRTLCPTCIERAHQFARKAFTPTPSGAERLKPKPAADDAKAGATA